MGATIDKSSALSARPHRLPVVKTEDRDNGGLLVTVRLKRRGLARFLSGSEEFDRTFGLDAVGREVYEACDGRRTVRELVHEFAKAHKVTRAEAEVAVTSYLKTLMTKGLIAMEVEE